ncbi:Nephrocystin-3 [Tetrabaena socialis]|uniref:Nephrocystin-3 n=1 Tax=Tetrabaena socialis TaxID=47790 RepID=A0A2J7ZRY2_9CHLO|nr:Nephrocystin-3 [Tetrabaena socialis]|eukprot:PNH03036.1 Nephrocystin-3 [Tetrabaena socialis]
MSELSDKVRTTVAIDSNAKLLAVHAVVEESRLLLKQASLYQDPAAAARTLVTELGGLEAVLGDGDKLRQVMQQLDVSARITIETVSSLLSSHLDKGPQRHILQPDLRLFWNKHYAGEAEVPWFAFWTDFPALLKGNPADTAMVDELGRLLADEAARAAFVRAVERSNRESISVWELKVAFSGDEGLLEQVSRMLLQVAAIGAHSTNDTATAAAMANVGALQTVPAYGGTGGVAPSIVTNTRCQLPPMVPNYVGRDKEATVFLEHLRTQGSLVLLAPGGMGKSCLAADVAWQMLRGGWAPGGALWVDLREASSEMEVEMRFCIALGLQQEALGNPARILAAIKALLPQSSPAAAGHCAESEEALKWQVPLPGALLVVDNAEDALLAEPQDNGGETAGGGICKEAPAVRLLVTSRTPIRLTSSSDSVTPSGHPTLLLPEQHVGAIGLGPASELVRVVAADLTEVEARTVAEACACVPLVLGLVAEALVAGRLALQHAVVQLAVFPSTFDEEAAAAVLGVTQPQAQAILALLHRHSMLQHGGAGTGGGASGRQQFIMHMVVRQQAMQMGRQLDPALLPVAEGRFVGSILGLLTEWATMYGTAKQWRLALAMACDRQADICRVLELIGGSSSEALGRGATSCLTTDNQGTAGTARSAPAAAAGGGVSLEAVAAALTTAEALDLLYDLGSTTQCLEAASRWLLARVTTGNQQKDLARGSFLYLAAWLNLKAGHYQVAEVYQRQALELRRWVLGTEHPDTATSISNLASCIHAQGRYAEAEVPYQQALELRRQLLGEEHTDTASSMDDLAGCIKAQGRYAEAEVPFRQALELRRRVLGEEHPKTATSINNLATCISAQGRYAEAEVPYRQALELRRRVLGEAHRDTATSTNNLASCINDQGRFLEAKPLYQQALDMRHRILGEEHPDTAASINNLAICVKALGHSSEAEPLYRQALELRRRVLGGEHPDTATSINNLAACINDQGRALEAEPLYRQALELRRRVLGVEHPCTANSVNNLAACIKALGRHGEVEPLYRQALELRQRVLGADHPDIAKSVSNLATCMSDQGRYSEAETLHRQALGLRRRVLGMEHPDTATSINNLASSINDQGRSSEAEPIYRQALELRQQLLGKEHPRTALSMNNLAACIKAQGRSSEVEPLYRQALDLRRRALGEDHPDTAASINNLAACINDQGRSSEAEPLYRQALELRRRILGEEHPSTATSLNNLASCIKALGRPGEVEPLYRQALELRQRVLGAEHPSTIQSINNLASCIKAQGRYGEAELLYQQVLELRQRILGQEHPDTATAANNLAVCVKAKKKKK